MVCAVSANVLLSTYLPGSGSKGAMWWYENWHVRTHTDGLGINAVA